MREFFEIAYAAASGQLCFFTGTGFSKAITGGKAPSWQQLLEDMCDFSDKPKDLKSSLFGREGGLSLEEVAQVISIELSKKKISIHEKISEQIGRLNIEGEISQIRQFFSSAKKVKAITTNYDRLLEELCGLDDAQSLAPGLPVPKIFSKLKVYHVHGSIEAPDNMVVTSDDYFNFSRSESYFSRKLSTVLHENTVVILGYSLGDSNLKSIINDYKLYSSNQIIRSNIFFVSRGRVNDYIKDYYSHCYSIRVIDEMEVVTFFEKLNRSMVSAQRDFEKDFDVFRNGISEKKEFSDEYIKTEDSFYQIISNFSALGLGAKNSYFIDYIDSVLKKKKDFATETGAWGQYGHLAKWLVYLASVLDIESSEIKDIYLDSCLFSMKTMDSNGLRGYSWEAYEIWKNGWSGLMASNRKLIRDYMNENYQALEVSVITESF